MSHHECAICLDAVDVSKADAHVKNIECDHCFHKPCLARWIATSPTCPLCRHQVNNITYCQLEVEYPSSGTPSRTTRDDDDMSTPLSEFLRSLPPLNLNMT